MDNCHAIVWIDHKTAHIIKFNRSTQSGEIVRNPDADKHIHHKAGEMGSGHVYEDDGYLREVSQHLHDAGTILITGPSQVKWQLKAFLGLRQPAMAHCIAGVESLNHPTDGELLAFARKTFKSKDRMRH
jgi:hypothetical protein